MTAGIPRLWAILAMPSAHGTCVMYPVTPIRSYVFPKSVSSFIGPRVLSSQMSTSNRRGVRALIVATSIGGIRAFGKRMPKSEDRCTFPKL